MMSSRVTFAIGTLCAVVILCLLGGWQLQRLAWKEDLIAKRIAGFEAAPVAPAPAVADWRRVRVGGLWLTKTPLMVGPVSFRGRTGWYAVSPLQTRAGGIVLINRGWTSDRTAVAPPQGKAGLLTGILRRPGPVGVFSPPNEPENKQWFRIDPAGMATALGLSGVAPYWIDLTEAPPGNGLRPVGTLTLPPNNHLQYAVTWFGFALTAAVIGLLFWIRNR